MLFLQKKKEKRTLETFSEKPTHPPKIHLLIPRDPEVQRVQEAVPTKKKEKRTLETFSEKLTHPSKSKCHLPFSIPRDPEVQKVQETVPTKKKEKRTLRMFSMFSEKPTHPLMPKFTYHFGFPFQIQVSRGSKKPFLQKRKEKER